jgi:hypothetical protein
MFEDIRVQTEAGKTGRVSNIYNEARKLGQHHVVVSYLSRCSSYEFKDIE